MIEISDIIYILSIIVFIMSIYNEYFIFMWYILCNLVFIYLLYIIY